ncbi:hypothetical protein [Actinoplanes sp. NPDC049316]|uniref:hypothetical protein n=1 Tax=Actinoplanes sp. NPDC049316 TaxID=3154727 RepID=UPI0034395752
MPTATNTAATLASMKGAEGTSGSPEPARSPMECATGHPAAPDKIRSMAIQRCPICRTEVRTNPRYPDHLCQDCATRAIAADGRPLKFFNTSATGGFEAIYADDNTPAEAVTRDHVVFVDGVRCVANEARFGGIVIRPAP